MENVDLSLFLGNDKMATISLEYNIIVNFASIDKVVIVPAGNRPIGIDRKNHGSNHPVSKSFNFSFF